MVQGRGRICTQIPGTVFPPLETAEGAASARNGSLGLVARSLINKRRKLHTAEKKGSQEERSTPTAPNPALGFPGVVLNQLFLLCDSSPLLLHLPFFFFPSLLEKAGLGIYTKQSNKGTLISAGMRGRFRSSRGVTSLQPSGRSAAPCSPSCASVSLPTSWVTPAPGHPSSPGLAESA